MTVAGSYRQVFETRTSNSCAKSPSRLLPVQSEASSINSTPVLSAKFLTAQTTAIVAKRYRLTPREESLSCKFSSHSIFSSFVMWHCNEGFKRKRLRFSIRQRQSSQTQLVRLLGALRARLKCRSVTEARASTGRSGTSGTYGR